ncbi:MAG: sulfite exporter TauE/SafE family protein [Phenylobacterium sp.]|nr:sulfite exporter TauE/SafE family protein [Phenylobacterium sp.]
MITLDFGGGLLLGLASSLHCAGMCGGIAASIALATAPEAGAGGRLVALLQAQAGKAAGYMAAGAALGWAGAGLYGALDMTEAFGILQKVSAAVLIWTALGLMGLVPSPAILGRLFQPLGRWTLKARRSARGLAATAAGLAWGLIPCGMVYAALLYALLAGTPGRGALVMAGFAVGVLPSVTATALGASSLVRAGARPALRLAAGGALIAFALATLVWPAGAAPGLCLPPA